MIGWIFGGVAVALVGGFVFTRSRKYGRIFSDDHVREVARAIPKLKAAALAGGASEPASAADPRIVQTSADLGIVYTVRQEGATYVHHISVSIAGGYTAHAVGKMFVAIAAKLVGLPIERMAFLVTPSTIHHGEVTLDADSHAAVVGAEVPEIDPLELRRAALDARIEFQRATPSP